MSPLFYRLELLFSASNKAKRFAKNFSTTSNLDDSDIFLPAFLSGADMKLHNIHVIPKLVMKIIFNVDFVKASVPDLVPFLALNKCEPDISSF